MHFNPDTSGNTIDLAGAIAGMLTGLIVTVVWRNVPMLKAAVYELVPAFFMALLAVYVVSLLTAVVFLI